jgi:glutaredoxin
MKEFKLFTKQGCKECELVKSILDIKGVEYQEKDVDSSHEEVEIYGIGKVPALVVLDKDDVIDSARGIEEIKDFIDHEL